MTLSEYEVIFSPDCRQKLKELASPEPLAEVLAIVLNDLGENPFAFRPAGVVDELGRTSSIRVAKTELYVSEVGVVPPLSFFFGIVESRKQVHVIDIMEGSGFGLKPDNS